MNGARSSRTNRAKDRAFRIVARTASTVAIVAAAGLAGCAPPPQPRSDGTASVSPRPAAPSPTAAESGRSDWAEEFDSDLGRWRYDIGAGDWGVGSIVYYTDRDTNSYVQDGVLSIVARAEHGTDEKGRSAEYTSARLVSRDAFMYGRFEARIKAPSGPGLWTAFWLLGVYDDQTDWPNVGEIDVVELVREGGTAYSTLWGNLTGSDDPWSYGIEAPASGGSWAEDWHVFAAEWDREGVTFFIDDEETGRITPADLEDGWRWSLTQPVNIILNLAVGGDWPGPPNADTQFPAALQVDWVRVSHSEVTPDA